MTNTPAAGGAGPRTVPLAAGLPIPTGARRLSREFGYLLAGLPVGIAAFVVAVAGFAAGVGTLVVWLGLPILAGTLRAARGLATVERRAVRWATGRELPPYYYRRARGHRVARRLLRTLADPQSWRDLLHCVVAFPVRVATFSIAVSWAVGGLGGTLFVLWEWSLPRSEDSYHGLFWLLTDSPSWLGDIALNTTIGLFLLLSLPWVVRGLVAVHAGLARGLLTNQTAALRARTEQLAAGRRAAVQAEAQTLRRLERDLHDGPQQRLVRLNMDLETAARRLDDDPDRVRPLLDEALEQSREALSELRSLSRGIAAGAGRPWPRRGPGGRGRALPGAGQPRRRATRRRAAGPCGGEHGVLRRHRGAHQRGQALRGDPVRCYPQYRRQSGARTGT